MAMLKQTHPVLISLLLLLSSHLFAQSSLEQTISEQQQQATQFPFEKAYMQLDKSYYATGDTVWFKAYVVIGSKHQLSALSNVLNVELIDSKDSVKQHIKLFIKNGLCQGDLDLPLNIESGNYRIRAYTNWMRNAGEEYFFDKSITFINTGFTSKITSPKKVFTTKAVFAKPAAPNVDIQFFPEGGSFALGIPSKIAFKAIGANGLGADIKGIITDEQNNTVATFTSTHLGIGVFMLTAEAGKTYIAKIKLADSSVRMVQLPKVINTGYALNVSAAGTDYIRVIAQKVSDVEGAPTEAVTLLGRAGGIVYYEAKSKPGSSSLIATIAKNKFPTGIIQFTLLSAQGEPLNERQLFVQNNDQLKIAIATENQTYTPQQKVNISLNAKIGDINNKPVQGSFSVAVIDESKLPADDVNENNILSNLLLTSDLKGYIEKPGYYFASADEKAADDLDALMLTQGYRRFEWKKVANNEQKAILYPADTGLTISGHLTKGGKPVANGKVTLYSMDSGFFAWDTVTNNEGRFAFRHLDFFDQMNFVVQSAEKERDRYHINVEMDRLTAVSNKNALGLATTDEKDILPFTQNRKQLYAEEVKYDYNGKARLLKEVVIKEKPQENLASPNSVLKTGHADYVITAKQLKALPCGNVSECLIGLLPGVKHSTFIVDGVLTRNIDQVNPRTIESIEVVLRAGSSILYVTLKRGLADDDMKYTENLPGYKKFSANGFYKVCEFYSPQYDNPNTNKEIADLRTTIYWDPMLQTGKDGNASFEYFNAGSKGNYKVVVEGIDTDGNLGRVVYRYKVE